MSVLSIKAATKNIKERDSGIESLKFLAAFLIIISHVVQTLGTKNTYVAYSNYMLPLAESTTSVENFTLACLRYFGVFGNMIFFICTAYFLLESTKINLKKWFSLLAEVWSISVIILIIVLFARGGANLSKDLILKSFLVDFKMKLG